MATDVWANSQMRPWFGIDDEALPVIMHYGRKAIALENEIGPLRERLRYLEARNALLERQVRHLKRLADLRSDGLTK
jgi:hypothetical protein